MKVVQEHAVEVITTMVEAEFGSPQPSRQRAKRMADRGMPTVIALAEPQQDVAVEQTGIAARHQS